MSNINDTENKIRRELFALRDLKYKDFQAALMPTVSPKSIIGVRMPVLRKYAKTLAETEKADFLTVLPHEYYDENNLHALLIEPVKDYDRALALIEEFLPYVDNWATCDLIASRAFGKNTDRLLENIRQWISSDRTYTIRFGLRMLMEHFLDESFSESFLELAAGIVSEEYYVNMMLAWFFATALAKQYEAAVGILERRELSMWVHSKTIQKAIESFRISDEQKAYLRTLRNKPSKRLT